MVDTMKYLVDKFHVVIGYVQSDEITLLWDVQSWEDGEYMFSGKFQKLTSVLAATASAYFARRSMELLPEKNDELPTFDCRVWQVPNRQEAANAFYWRELDATKNAISMAAHAYFSHKILQGMSGSEKQELLWSKEGINFNDYPAFFKRGVYARRVTVDRQLDEETLAKIPEDRRPAGGWVKRTEIKEMDWPPCKSIANYMELLYGMSSSPMLRDEPCGR
jgi:tRNA(His) 5'-end guanylyltransferase